ncbi:MAG: hemerythrin domain-containing protein [Deltaproteobacteria bacterium]|nr:hemerythrin domain-containing protein [Deltaproteobacteria bacterium]
MKDSHSRKGNFQIIDSDLLSELHSDHMEVANLLGDFERQDLRTYANDIFPMLKEEITAHCEAEQLTIYNKLAKEDESLIKAAKSEHHEIKEFLKTLESTSLTDEKAWEETFKDLKSAVQHHVEEEESEMFELISRQMSKKMQDELYDQFMEAKDELKSSGRAA